MKMNFKKLLNIAGDNIIGLDIGSSSVKMVKLSKDNGNYIADFAALSEIKDDQNASIIEAVRDCVKTSGAIDRQAACSLGGQDIVVRDFRFPLLPEEEIASAVQFEAAQVSPFDIEQAMVDFQLVPSNNEHIQGILVAAKKSLVEEKCSIIKSASLNCALVSVDGLEILNCFTELEKDEAGKAVAILNVGNNYSNLIITNDEGVPFIRDIGFGGKAINEKLSEENIKIENIDRTEESQLKFHHSLAAACKELIEAVYETIRYCSINRKSGSIEKIYVCGGFSQTQGFIQLLNDRLSASAVLWNPFDKIAWPMEQRSKEVIQNHGFALAVATGLAMRQFSI